MQISTYYFLLITNKTLTYHFILFHIKPTQHMRNILIAIVAILYLILGWLFYQDHNRCCVTTTTEVQNNERLLLQNTGPLLFSYNNSIPITGDTWSAMRDSLNRLISDTTSLEITGWYCANLSPPETKELGIARAAEIKKLFPEYPEGKITIVAKGVDCQDGRIDINDIAASFTTRVSTADVQEIEDRTIIYFSYNSTSRLKNESVETYLKQVAERVIKSGESILLTGHTDNIGSDETNNMLGKKRADTIKQYLISRGVNAEKVKVLSKGKSEPIADNTTDEGRAKNRRTELQIIQ